MEMDRLKTEKKEKEGEKNMKNKHLSNQQVELIKKVVNEQNLKLVEKDGNITSLNSELKDLKKDIEEYKNETNSEIDKAFNKGINQSINQIKFLQTEVLTCKNILSDNIKEKEMTKKRFY